MNDDMMRLPRIFCDNVKGGFSKEHFVLGLFSGLDVEMYALAPAHAKRLAIWMAAQVKAYEAQFGEIDANLLKPTVSPIQFTDPSQNNSEDSGNKPKK
jgi:hypothetical protein